MVVKVGRLFLVTLIWPLSWQICYLRKKFGFCEIWINWVYQMLSSAKLSIMVNGGSVIHLRKSKVFFGNVLVGRKARCLGILGIPKRSFPKSAKVGDFIWDETWRLPSVSSPLLKGEQKNNWYTMFVKFVVFFLVLKGSAASEQDDLGFTYNGFSEVNMSLDGLAQITNNGLLMLVNNTKQQMGHALYPHPLHFKNSSTGSVFSFSTTFVFAMFSQYRARGGTGMAFVIAPSSKFPGASAGTYLGLFNLTSNGKSSNHIIAIELDCLRNLEFYEIDGNHVGIDLNDLKSVESAPASYFSDKENRNVNLTLFSGQAMQLWVEYSGPQRQLNVTLAPFDVPKPTIPLLSLNIDLSPIAVDTMFVGFSSATLTFDLHHYVLGWSFKMNGKAKELTISQLPKLPRFGPRRKPRIFSLGIPVIGVTLLLILIFRIQFIVKTKKKFAEVLEDWELDYRPHRFKYRDLYIATKGFKNKELLGVGGFGRVYRGVLPKSKAEVAVKRVSYNSRQGEREFVAEIISIGKLRNRNIVPLLGYCRRKGELLLVYDFMPNGSLDKYLFDQKTIGMTLNWNQRFRIIKSVAAALLYLHEEWEKVVVHRDVKSSNVLIDKEFNGRLGDFGLARLYDHGTVPKTTHVVGTLGYLAPELCRIGKASPSVDVFAFGAFLLEVACGRRPIEPEALEERAVLVDWVVSCWKKGRILDTVDPKLGMDYEVQKMEVVLKLGLVCSHSIPTARPTMRQVVRYLEREVPLLELTLIGPSTTTNDTTFMTPIGSGDISVTNLQSTMTRSSSVVESILSGGR
ncbi:L-type lectin-domain containing receptor kinase IV.1-like [Macadamia integrifolia]|uniref:L-type lectin-domain containing receptor kinase IV.1-like n=1 Tax=Macadamia integrifolia TaxID=60698 RepID=UPI001C4EB4B5|nr:L-type lectin-domain containing receptor kinase IV.1-like [Macadamia integrifolia]